MGKAFLSKMLYLKTKRVEVTKIFLFDVQYIKLFLIICALAIVGGLTNPVSEDSTNIGSDKLETNKQRISVTAGFVRLCAKYSLHP